MSGSDRPRGIAAALLIAIGALAILLAPSGAWGAPGASTIVVVAGGTERSPESEDIHRIAGELAADGLTVRVDASLSYDDLSSLARIARDSGATLLACIFVANDGLAVDVVLLETVTGRTERRRLDAGSFGGEHAREVLARRTADFVRAMLLDFAMEAVRAALARPRAAPPSPRVAARAPEIAPQDSTGQATLAMGAALLTSTRGLGAAVLPIVRAGIVAAPGVSVRVSLAGLGTQPTASTAAGTATIEQSMAFAEVAVVPWRAFWLRPQATVGMGAYFVRAQGSAAPPYSATDVSRTAFAVAAGVGLAAALASHFQIVGEFSGMLAFPGVSLRLAGDDAARLGRPSLITTLAISVIL